ncbi:MAG: ribonuclease HII [Candidatus Omnitrophica bacterium]|nr:ribonuclease HII [Candidatus Omnitrophota bacterium]
MFYHEKKAKGKGFSFIIGVDEAGRGPLAGPVVAAAVKLNRTKFRNRIDDSKKLSSLQREKAFPEIFQNAFVGVGVINERIIDTMNILNATKLAMENAVNNLLNSSRKKIRKHKVIVLIDGNLTLDLPFKTKSIVGGDSKSLSIASASIIAKVVRDRIMSIYDNVYPEYSFKQNKGYGTKGHFKAIEKHGSCVIHRMSFYPLNGARKKFNTNTHALHTNTHE